MGTTATSGWAVLWFLVGFIVLGTTGIGGGALGFLTGIVIMAWSSVLFRAARAKEE